MALGVGADREGRVVPAGAPRPRDNPQAFTHLALISAAYNLDRQLG